MFPWRYRVHALYISKPVYKAIVHLTLETTRIRYPLNIAANITLETSKSEKRLNYFKKRHRQTGDCTALPYHVQKRTRLKQASVLVRFALGCSISHELPPRIRRGAYTQVKIVARRKELSHIPISWKFL